jgi:hypothetical protein
MDSDRAIRKRLKAEATKAASEATKAALKATKELAYLTRDDFKKSSGENIDRATASAKKGAKVIVDGAKKGAIYLARTRNKIIIIVVILLVIALGAWAFVASSSIRSYGVQSVDLVTSDGKTTIIQKTKNEPFTGDSAFVYNMSWVAIVSPILIILGIGVVNRDLLTNSASGFVDNKENYNNAITTTTEN